MVNRVYKGVHTARDVPWQEQAIHEMHFASVTELDKNKTEWTNPEGRTSEINGLYYHEPIHYLNWTYNDEHNTMKRIQH